MKFLSLLMSLISLFVLTSTTNAVMTGGTYSIPIDSFSVVEGDELSGGDFSLLENVGESAAGEIQDGSYLVRGGFLQADQLISLSLDKSAISLDFGSNPLTTMASDTLVAMVSTDSDSGYVLSLTEDGNLRSGTNDINDVLDGVVTVGSEEYGINTTGGDGLLVLDTGISSTLDVASNSGPVFSQAISVIFKASASTATKSGNYSQIVTFTATVNP